MTNAIYDGADAVMLSGESANGQYPVESIATMNAIVQASEAVLTKKALADFACAPGPIDGTAKAAVLAATAAGATCIVRRARDARARASSPPPPPRGERSGSSALVPFPLLFSPPRKVCTHVATGFGDQLARAISKHKPGMPVVCFAETVSYTHLTLPTKLLV